MYLFRVPFCTTRHSHVYAYLLTTPIKMRRKTSNTSKPYFDWFWFHSHRPFRPIQYIKVNMSHMPQVLIHFAAERGELMVVTTVAYRYPPSPKYSIYFYAYDSIHKLSRLEWILYTRSHTLARNIHKNNFCVRIFTLPIEYWGFMPPTYLCLALCRTRIFTWITTFYRREYNVQISFVF